MTEKRYLKWYNKVGYGSGDIAGNVVYAFLSSFVMIYLTNTVGLNPGIVGTLIAVSKLLDGMGQGVANFGYASALSFVIFVMVAILSFISMKAGDKRD